MAPRPPARPHWLINLAYLDPPRNGGIARQAQEVSRAVLAAAAAGTARVTYLVRGRFVPQFRAWLGDDLPRPAIMPYSRLLPLAALLRWLRPTTLVSPLLGVDPVGTLPGVRHLAALPDTLSFDHPAAFSPADQAARRATVDRCAAPDTILITLSDFSRGQILRHTAFPPERVIAIPLGADPLGPDRLPAAPPPDIPAPYVFYPANSWPHKRHGLLLAIMDRLWETEPDLRLVLTGGRVDGGDLPVLIAACRRPGQVIDLGYVSEHRLASLYAGARAVLFTTAYEGFGMPLVEAMQAGCPVIAAPLTAIPAVAGEAALYVPADQHDQPDAWARVYRDVLPARRDALIAAGREQAARFTWARTRSAWLAELTKPL